MDIYFGDFKLIIYTMFNTKILTSLALGAHLNSHGFHGLCSWCIFFMGIFRCRLHSHGVYIFFRCSNGERWERAHNFPRKKSHNSNPFAGLKILKIADFCQKFSQKKLHQTSDYLFNFSMECCRTKIP